MNDLNPIYNLIRSDGSIVINKNLCHAIGINETMVYSELLSRYNYFNVREELDEDGYFFNTVHNLQLATCVGEKPQKKAISTLKRLGLIEYKVKGMPPKRYFKIINNPNLLMELLEYGEVKIIELQEKQVEAIEKSKLRLLGGIKTTNRAEMIPPIGRVNNTKPNNTKFNNTNSIKVKGAFNNARGIGYSIFINLYKDNESYNEDIDKSIRYLLERRFAIYGFRSPKYKYDTWVSVFNSWFDVDTGYRNEKIDYDQSIEMIDTFLEIEFENKNCDYSPYLFSNDDVKRLRYVECNH